MPRLFAIIVQLDQSGDHVCVADRMIESRGLAQGRHGFDGIEVGGPRWRIARFS